MTLFIFLMIYTKRHKTVITYMVNDSIHFSINEIIITITKEEMMINF